MKTNSDWRSVSRQCPCPICGKPDNCKVARDGSAVWCGRVEQGSDRQNAGGQFLHVLRDRNESPEWPRRSDHQPKVSANWPSSASIPKPKPPSKDWGRIAKEAFANSAAAAARQELAARLGVDVDALVRLGVGWLHSQRCWTFPERDAVGNVFGINRRFADGKKQRMAGSQSGLTFDPGRWLESVIEPSFVLLVEGGSDVAALMTLGLSVVGRPNNTGGIELLVELLRAVPNDRTIVVIGEHDRKPHESLSPAVKQWHKPTCDGCSVCWPGKYGADTTATKLAEQLERPIAWAFPPENAKDARAWLNSQPADRRNE